MESTQPGSNTLLIGDLVVDVGRRQIRRGKKVLDLPRLSYKLVLTLAQSAPNVVTQDELVQQVWSGKIVSPETVTQRVKLVRKALGDDASSPRYIGVVRGQGYRLLPDVVEQRQESAEPVQASPRSRTIRRRQYVAAFAVSLVIVSAIFYWVNGETPIDAGIDSTSLQVTFPENAETDTVAVMPFVNASRFASDQYISEGLGDALRDQLGRIAGMRVAARSSSVIFKDQAIDATEIASRLSVAKLIEGTVRRQGDVVHVTVTIVDGKTGFALWSENFRKATGDMLSVQQQIATAIVARMMPGADPRLAESTSATLNASANELLQLARYSYQQVKDKSVVDYEQLLKAIEYYRQATLADPESALAHSRYAEALLYLGNVDDAGEAIDRALQLNPDLSEVQNTLGLYRWLRYEPGSGEAHFRAISLNPNNADALGAYGKWLWHQQVTDASEVYFLRALQLDPESLSRYIDLGNFYGISGQRDKALEIASEIRGRFPTAPGFLNLARIHELAGNLDVGIAWAHRASALDPDYPDARWMLAELHGRINDVTGAERYDPEGTFTVLYWLRRYPEMIEVGEDLIFDHPNQIQIWYGLARAYNAIGDYENAIRILEQRGVPEIVLVDSRRANGVEALATYADALGATGEVSRAQELASWSAAYLKRLRLTGSDNSWWPNLYEACARSVLGQDDVALQLLNKVPDSPGLLWYPVLVDSPCFDKFDADPTYQAVVNAIEQRQSILRDRLPATLKRFQVDVELE